MEEGRGKGRGRMMLCSKVLVVLGVRGRRDVVVLGWLGRGHKGRGIPK